MKKPFNIKEYKPHCISYINVHYVYFVLLGTITGFIYLYKPSIADIISYEFIGNVLMLKLLITYLLKIICDLNTKSNIITEYISSKLTNETIKSALMSSLFFLGFAIFLFIRDSAPHGTLALYGCIYFFCFSEILSTPLKDQKSVIYLTSTAAIIGIPLSPLGQLL